MALRRMVLIFPFCLQLSEKFLGCVNCRIPYETAYAIQILLHLVIADLFVPIRPVEWSAEAHASYLSHGREGKCELAAA